MTKKKRGIAPFFIPQSLGLGARRVGFLVIFFFSGLIGFAFVPTWSKYFSYIPLPLFC